MYAGRRKSDHRFARWIWMLWDWNWLRARTADSVVKRIRSGVGNGDIVVMHDGDESAPVADQRQTVEATARLIPLFKSRGFVFRHVC